MFTGIIEEVGEIVDLNRVGDNLDIGVRAKMTPELKIDQSVAHNGICLTVVDIQENIYRVTAPINKHTIQSEDFNFPGHTDYLAVNTL